MAADGQIEIQLTLETGEVVKAFANVENQAKKTGENSESFWAKAFQTGIAIKAVDAIADSVKKFSDAVVEKFEESIKKSLEFEESVSKLKAAFLSAGISSQGTLNSFLEFADQTANNSKYTKEQIIDLEKLSLTYSKNTDHAKELIKASIALSAATGKDVNSSLQILSGTLEGLSNKTLNHLPGGFRELTKSQLESGEALRILISRFGSLAGAETQTTLGLINQIEKAFSELQVSFGNIITKTPFIKEALNGILNSIKDFNNIQTLTETMKQLLIALSGIGTAISFSVIPAFEFLYNVFSAVAKRFSSVIGAIVESFQGRWKSALITLSEDFKKTHDEVTRFNWTSNAIDFFDKLHSTAAQTSTALVGVKTHADDANKSLVNASTSALNLTNVWDGLVKQFDHGKDGLQKSSLQTETTVQSLGQTIQTSLGQGITSAFSAVGAALVKGQNGFGALGKAALGTIGAIAIQIGSFLVMAGLGFSFIPGFQASSAAIPEGLALIVLGGALQALSGGGSSSSATSGGGVSSSASSAGVQQSISNPASAGVPSTGLIVNVQGSVFDTEQTGLRIADIIRTNFDKKDVRFA